MQKSPKGNLLLKSNYRIYVSTTDGRRVRDIGQILITKSIPGRSSPVLSNSGCDFTLRPYMSDIRNESVLIELVYHSGAPVPS